MTEPKYAELETALREPPPRPVPKSFKRALVKKFSYPIGGSSLFMLATGFIFAIAISLQILLLGNPINPLLVAIPIIMLLPFLYAIISTARVFQKNTWLFSNGTLAQGTVKSINKTRMKIATLYRYKISVSYLDQETFYYAYGDDVARAEKWEKDKTPLRVLYNPEKPKDAIVLESIIGMNAGGFYKFYN
jgi:hypothetical protein